LRASRFSRFEFSTKRDAMRFPAWRGVNARCGAGKPAKKIVDKDIHNTEFRQFGRFAAPICCC
jgi:hypothetical protein